MDIAPAPSSKELKNWLMEGNKKLSIDDEITFCDSDVLLQVLQCKVG